MKQAHRETIIEVENRQRPEKGHDGYGSGEVQHNRASRADTREERAAVDKYKMGDTMLYEKNKMLDPGSGLLGVASRLAFAAVNTTVSVKDLVQGKSVECKDIVEMLAIEAQIIEAAKTFNDVLHAAATFGGEQIIDLAQTD